jgi:uncharacterized protein YoxC
MAAAFVVLVSAILLMLQQVGKKISRLAAAAESVQEEVLALIGELRNLSRSTADTVAGMQRQLKRADRLLGAADELGDTASNAAAAARRITEAVEQTAMRFVAQAEERYKPQINEALDWTELGLTAWRWWQSKRHPASPSPKIPQGTKSTNDQRSV